MWFLSMTFFLPLEHVHSNTLSALSTTIWRKFYLWTPHHNFMITIFFFNLVFQRFPTSMLTCSFLLYKEPHHIILQHKLVVWKNKFQLEFFFLSCNSSSFHEVLFFLVACTYQNENSFFCCVEDKVTMQPFYSYLEEETTMQAWFVRKEEEEMQCNTSFFFLDVLATTQACCIEEAQKRKMFLLLLLLAM